MSSSRLASQETANLVIRRVQAAHKPGTRRDMRTSALTKHLAAAMDLVDQGLSNSVIRPTLGYKEACKIARSAAASRTSGADDLGQASEFREDGVQDPQTLVSPVSEPRIQTPAPKTAITSFHLLLKDHLEISKAASARSSRWPNLEPARALDSTRSTPIPRRLEQVDTVHTEVLGRLEESKIRVKDANGDYLETYVEKIYQVLKPHLKGLRYHPSESLSEIKADIQGRLECRDLKQVLAQYKFRQITKIVRLLAIRGLFLVDYQRFSKLREAADEARRLVPGFTHVYRHVAPRASNDRTMSRNDDAEMVMQGSTYSGGNSSHNSPNDGETFLLPTLAVIGKSQRLQGEGVSARTVTSELSFDDHLGDLPSLPGDMWDEHPSPRSPPDTAEAISEAPTSAAVLEAPTPLISDELSHEAESPSQDTTLERAARWQKRSHGASPQNSVKPMRDVEAIESQTGPTKFTFEFRDDEPENEQSQGHLATSVVSYNLETDDDMALAEPVALYRCKSNSRADPIHPDIDRYATVAIPATRAFYLPYAAQHKILCSLQASLEQVCFEYIQRENPEILEETQKQWGFDSPHALELNQYIHLLSTEPESRSGRSRSTQDLYESLIVLRHHAVHRKRVNIQALRRWASDASIFAAVLGNSTAAAQFSPLAKYLETQHHRIEADKSEAEDRLIATVKDLAAKRAELDRLEQEAMNEYNEEHKQFSARALANLDEFNARVHVDHGLRDDIGDTSSTEPARDNSEETSSTEPVNVGDSLSSEPKGGDFGETSSAEALNVERPSSSELVSSIMEKASPTDPISGVFGRLKLWHGA